MKLILISLLYCADNSRKKEATNLKPNTDQNKTSTQATTQIFIMGCTVKKNKKKGKKISHKLSLKNVNCIF